MHYSSEPVSYALVVKGVYRESSQIEKVRRLGENSQKEKEGGGEKEKRKEKGTPWWRTPLVPTLRSQRLACI